MKDTQFSLKLSTYAPDMGTPNSIQKMNGNFVPNIFLNNCFRGVVDELLREYLRMFSEVGEPSHNCESW